MSSVPRAITAHRRVITDPARLDDSLDVHGQRITVIGDDGEVLVMLGHPATREAHAAFEAFAVEHLGWDAPDDVGDDQALERRWARFEIGGCDCPTPAPRHWHMSYIADSRTTPDLIAVTVLDRSWKEPAVGTTSPGPDERAVVADMDRHVGRLLTLYTSRTYRVLGVGPVVDGEREIWIELVHETVAPDGEPKPAGYTRTITAFADETFPVHDDQHTTTPTVSQEDHDG